jgi:hypothetical protein
VISGKHREKSEKTQVHPVSRHIVAVVVADTVVGTVGAGLRHSSKCLEFFERYLPKLE